MHCPTGSPVSGAAARNCRRALGPRRQEPLPQNRSCLLFFSRADRHYEMDLGRLPLHLQQCRLLTNLLTPSLTCLPNWQVRNPPPTFRNWQNRANCQSLAFSERGQLSEAIPQFHVTLWPIAQSESRHNGRRVCKRTYFCVSEGDMTANVFVAIRIATMSLQDLVGYEKSAQSFLA